jgi:hypothetical protein
MARLIFSCSGGQVALPSSDLVLVSREDGGNLIVNPPREVWERSELTATELTRWSFLVAATGRAMIDALPQLEGGCVNYWEAGNWALNEAADPSGEKRAAEFRRVHLHLLGRSRNASSPAYRWGEAPMFPAFADRHAWASRFKRLTPAECLAIVERTVTTLRRQYGFIDTDIEPWAICGLCGYPTPGSRNPCDDCMKG